MLLLLAGAAVASGKSGLLLQVFAAATLHEMAHIAVARRFGLHVEKLSITPLGEHAQIMGLEAAGPRAGAAVAAAGPMASLLLALAFWGARDFALANLAVLALNMLPAYPLDGGRLLRVLLGNRIGVLRANRAAARLTRAVCALMFLAGLAVAALFPYDLSLVCIAVYLRKNLEAERVRMASSFFRFFGEQRFARGKALRIKLYSVGPETEILRMLDVLCWDSYCVFIARGDDGTASSVDEGAVVAHFRQSGGGRVRSLLEKRAKRENDRASE
jgi:Zn-dependent protease